MSTLRQDITTDEWVILSPRRASRPLPTHTPERAPGRRHDPACPFCPGNEGRTPPEILRTQAPGGGWEQRVFPNRYPALGPEPEPEDGPREVPGIGAHEVVVETPLHDERIDEMSVERVARILRVWRERYVALEEQPWARAVIVFKNFGERAGISLPHPHGQILATPIAPPGWLLRRSVAARHLRETGGCVYEDLRDSELQSGDRIVTERERFVVLVPFAARAPYESWILPRGRGASFAEAGDEDLLDLATVLRDLLRAVRTAAGDPDFNLLVRSAPAHDADTSLFLWHLQLLPRASIAAGFEMATGMAINTLAPEDAAADLRKELETGEG